MSKPTLEDVLAKCHDLRKQLSGDDVDCICPPRECSWDKAGAFESRDVDPKCPVHGEDHD